jgi:hypothetical protein
MHKGPWPGHVLYKDGPIIRQGKNLYKIHGEPRKLDMYVHNVVKENLGGVREMSSFTS